MARYLHGPQTLVRMLVDSSTSAISVGDFVVAASAGYVKQASAGESPVGIACEVSAVPTADGDLAIMVDVSRGSVWEYPPDAGTVSQALCNTTMDIGGPASINIDASSQDVIIVRAVDLVANTLHVSLIPTYAGVV